MSRIFGESSLLIASHNERKIAEIAGLLENYVPKFTSSLALKLGEPEETETSFEGNAILKAQAAAKSSGVVSLADDSGFCVFALGGRPGVYSARYATVTDGHTGEAYRDFDYAMDQIAKELEDKDDKTCSFVCSLALAWPDGHVETVLGEVLGRVVHPPRGPCDFGYDPIFLPDGHDQTFAEMGYVGKQKISHRAMAFQALLDKCFI